MIRFFIAGIAFVALASACSGGGSNPALTATAHLGAEGAASSVAQASPIASVGVSATPNVTPVCGSTTDVPPPTPGDMTVNADGDGVPDRMSLYSISPFPEKRDVLQLVLNERTVLSVQLPFQDQSVALIGGYDVNGSGREELFVNTGWGAYAEYVDLYLLDLASCSLVRLEGPAWHEPSAPAPPITAPQFCVGASMGSGCGLTCAGGLLISTHVSRVSDDPLTYGAEVTSYDIEGVRLRAVSMTTRDNLGPGEGVGFDCGGLRLPPFRPPG